MIFPIDRISHESNEKHFKLLGVLLDENLSFKAHIDMLCSKISKSLFCINRVKNFVDESSLRKLYFSMVHSHLSYGINVYGCATSTALEKLRVMQKKAIRVIKNANYRAHTAPLFQELKILPLDDLILYSNTKFMHYYYLKQLPLSLYLPTELNWSNVCRTLPSPVSGIMPWATNLIVNTILYSGRTKYSAFVSKLSKLSEEYLSPQKTQKAAVFFI